MNKICTSIKQSQKLIELGISFNTADMCYCPIMDIDSGKSSGYLETPECYPFSEVKDSLVPYLPAWSLSSLLELIPPYLGEFNDGIDFGFSKSMNGKWYSAHYIQLDNSGLATFTKTVTGDTAIDAAFEMVVWLKENEKI